MTSNDINTICEKLDSLHQKILEDKFAEKVYESEVLALILAVGTLSRQQSEIERLKSVLDIELDTIHDLRDDYDKILEEEPVHIQKAKIKVLMDFAERLNDKATSTFFKGYKYVDTNDVYDTLEEMEREIIEY